MSIKKYSKIVSVPDLLFTVCFTALFFCTFYSGTTFVEYGSIKPLWNILRLMSALLIMIKVVVYDKYSLKRFIVTVFSIGVSLVVFLVSDRGAILDTTLLIIGAYNIHYKKVLKLYIIIASIMLLVTFLCCITGLIVDYTTIRTQVEQGISARVRHSFGINYTTDFAAHVFFIFISCCVYHNSRIRNSVLILIGTVLVLFLEYFCNARVSELSIMITCVLFIALNFKNSARNRKLKYASIIAFPLCAVFSIAMTLLFDPSKKAWVMINRVLFSGRLSVTKRVINKYGIYVFGQPLLMQGLGYKVDGFDASIGNTYIDSSYLQILVLYGIMALILIITLMTSLSIKAAHDNNNRLMIAMIVIAINCIMNQYLLHIAYNPFFLVAASYIWANPKMNIPNHNAGQEKSISY